jgi:hypothetical protein
MDEIKKDEWQEHMAKMNARQQSGPVTIRFNREGLRDDKFAMANARVLESLLIQFKPDYTEWRDPLTQKIVMVMPRDFYDNNRTLFEALPDVETY